MVFTCAVSRAVHLELVLDYSECELLNCFQMFTTRRSGSNLVAGSKTLKALINGTCVENFLNLNRIQWKFITTRARIVGLTKDCLKKVVGNALLSFRELQIFIFKIEAKLNDRPLTYISDIINNPIPLTPSHLIKHVQYSIK